MFKSQYHQQAVNFCLYIAKILFTLKLLSSLVKMKVTRIIEILLKFRNAKMRVILF